MGSDDDEEEEEEEGGTSSRPFTPPTPTGSADTSTTTATTTTTAGTIVHNLVDPALNLMHRVGTSKSRPCLLGGEAVRARTHFPLHATSPSIFPGLAQGSWEEKSDETRAEDDVQSNPTLQDTDEDMMMGDDMEMEVADHGMYYETLGSNNAMMMAMNSESIEEIHA